MNEFVQECLGEWRRLGVADAVATEMAAELTADLSEAVAEGATTEAVLGTSAFEPRAFAAAWASERGVIPPVPAESQPAPVQAEPLASPPTSVTVPEANALWRRLWVPALVAVFVLIGVAGVALAFSSRDTGVVVSKQVTANPDGSADLRPSPRFRIVPPMKPPPGAVVVPPNFEIVPPFVGPGPEAVLSIDHRGRNLRVLGFLLIVLAAGGVALTAYRHPPTGWLRRQEV